MSFNFVMSSPDIILSLLTIYYYNVDVEATFRQNDSSQNQD